MLLKYPCDRSSRAVKAERGRKDATEKAQSAELERSELAFVYSSPQTLRRLELCSWDIIASCLVADDEGERAEVIHEAEEKRG
jgi:hypothetical protein